MLFLFAGFTVVYFVVAEFFLPETKGKTLEEIEAQFEGRAASYSIFGITVDRKHIVQVAFSSRKSHLHASRKVYVDSENAVKRTAAMVFSAVSRRREAGAQHAAYPPPPGRG